MNHVSLTIEKSSDGYIWGRVFYEDNLISERAKTLEQLEKKFKKLLQDFHDVNPDTVAFDIAHDLTSVFEEHSELKISAVAEKAGVNPSLMRQYAAGKKFPSPDKVKAIEGAIHKIGNKLTKIKLSTPGQSGRGRKKKQIA